MIWERPLFLWLLVLPLLWAGWQWRTTARRLALILKVLTFAVVIVALATPSFVMPERKTGTIVLVDTSTSISDRDLAEATSIVKQITAQRGRNFMRVLPFAKHVGDNPADGQDSEATFRRVSGDNARGTDFEVALRDSMAAMPFGYVPRVALLSDGNNNEGSVARAIAQLQRLNIPVDTFLLGGQNQGKLRLVSVTVPAEAYADEQVPVLLTVESSSASKGELTLKAEGKTLGKNPVELKTGPNQIRALARVRTDGVTSISGHLSTDTAGDLDFERALTLKSANLLYLSQDPAGSEANLVSALTQGGFHLDRRISRLDHDMDDVQLVVLNNLDLDSFTASQKSRLDRYVQDGGGLLLIGGERQVYKEDDKLDALDRVLPAKLAPPKSPEGTCVALIMDKSSSMEGRKIELARASAAGVIDHLRPFDSIGILIFDNSFQWAVPLRRAEDKPLIRRLIAGITPDGGTQIAPAVSEGYRKILTFNATSKHIVLLTDGISEEGDSLELAREALQHGVTISTVGLGQDVNRAYLEKIAKLSGGKSYLLTEPQGLEQILLKDVQEFSGSTSVERPLQPIVNRKAEVLEQVGMEAAPPLRGYARYTAKPATETILSIDPEKKDPLYVRWQYGLGRAAVFTSDAKSRWAEAWMKWPGFDRFWINTVRDLLPRGNQTEVRTEFDQADRQLTIEYHLGTNPPSTQEAPELFALGPNSFRKPVDLKQVAPGTYRGRVDVGETRGLFRVRPLKESKMFPETGFYREESELTDNSPNEAVLQQISRLTGGAYNPSPASVFQSGGRVLYTRWQLWPLLLGIAILLTVLELLNRKWPGVAGRLFHRNG